MAKATTVLPLTDAWVQVANSGQTFMFSVVRGHVLLRYSAAQPSGDDGHPFYSNPRPESYGDVSPTEAAWMRRGAGSAADASIVITKE